MGHGRREPPEQGGADERVDGNRREPVLGLARARRFRPTRQSGRREEEMDEHQRLVREGREGQETQKVAGPAGAQEKVLSVRSPAVPDAVRPGLEGRRPAGRRGAEQEAAAKGRAVRSASGGRGGRQTRNAAGRAVPAGRRPVVHGVAVARRQHVGRTAKDRLQNRRVATARPDQVQRRATAVRRARPPVFPGGLPAVPVRRQPARGRVVHATPTTARPGRGHELIVRVRHASRQTGDGRLESADLVAIRVRPRTARRRRRRRRRQSRFRRPRPRRQNRFRQLGRTIFRTNVSTAFPRHNVQYVLLVFRLTISAIAYILYIT